MRGEYSNPSSDQTKARAGGRGEKYVCEGGDGPSGGRRTTGSAAHRGRSLFGPDLFQLLPVSRYDQQARSPLATDPFDTVRARSSFLMTISSIRELGSTRRTRAISSWCSVDRRTGSLCDFSSYYNTENSAGDNKGTMSSPENPSFHRMFRLRTTAHSRLNRQE